MSGVEVFSEKRSSTLEEAKVSDEASIVPVVLNPLGWNALLKHARLQDYASGILKAGITVEDIFKMDTDNLAKVAEEKLKISKKGHQARLLRSIRSLRNEWFPKKEEIVEVDNETKANQDEGMSKSTKSSHSMHFTVTNQTDKKLQVYWVDYKGVETKYWSLTPGKTTSQQTFVTHPWKLRNSEDNTLVAWFVIKETDCDDQEMSKRKAIRRSICIKDGEAAIVSSS